MTGKFGKLLLKVLEAEVHTERLLVLLEKPAYLGDLRRRLRLHKYKSGNWARYPMSMPPFTLRTCPVM